MEVLFFGIAKDIVGADNVPLKKNDEIAIIPPVSGG